MDDAMSPKAAPSALSAAEKTAFLAALSETANVAASARKVGISTPKVYLARRKAPTFRDKWTEALCEGYARLEADLLAEALRRPSTQTSEMMLKVRAQKQRLGLNLLAMHRQSVKTESLIKPVAVKQVAISFTTQLLGKLLAMRSNNDNKRASQERASGGHA